MECILGIESTCDETAAAVVLKGEEVLSSVTSRQIDLHRQFGGVVPELASRRHLELIAPVIQEALREAGRSLHEIDAIAVSYGPGLLGAILVGLNTAKAFKIALKKPLIGVSHLEAHLYAAIMGKKALFPALGLVLSGGHTSLVFMEDLSSWKPLGAALDDAIGEAFDKVARLLSLPYPGGPPIEECAARGNKQAFPFKPATLKDRPFDFSYSGLKTSVMHAVSRLELDAEARCNIAASFQHAAFESVRTVLERAVFAYKPASLILGGGVTCNQALRSYIPKEVPTFWPTSPMSIDNAAMVAGLGYHKLAAKPAGDPLALQATPRLPL